MLLIKSSKYLSWNNFKDLYKCTAIETFDCLVHYFDQQLSLKNLMEEIGLTKEKKLMRKLKRTFSETEKQFHL